MTKSIVSFLGAGPGDPELITVKAHRLLAEADLVLYAGSLVNPDLLHVCKQGARLVDSAGLNLEEITALMVKGARSGSTVVRLQTGDPSFYSAIHEQSAILNDNNIAFEVVPGVSSAFASAAALKTGLTLPGITQTIILTRLAGRTPVPETEGLKSLAHHGATMCIFLSVSMIDKVVAELTGPYPPKTPAAVIYRASWPDELIIRSTLERIEEDVKRAGVTKHAMIIVSHTLGDSEIDAAKSKLYDSEFSHGYRAGKSENDA